MKRVKFGKLTLSGFEVAIKTVLNGELVRGTQTYSLGGGEWSLCAYSTYNPCIWYSPLVEFVGSNGTREPADDLWAEFDKWCEKVHHSFKVYIAPDGTTGSYKWWAKEIARGKLHGLIASL